MDVVIVASDACGILGDEIFGGVPPEAVGWVHTHPSGFGTEIQPSDCENVVVTGRADTGPSTGDVDTHEYFERQAGRELDGIILEKFRVYEFSSTDPDGTRYPSCTYR